MFRRTCVARKGFEEWPWPHKLPLKPHWYRHYAASPAGSVAREVRSVQCLGDMTVGATLGFIAFRAYTHARSGAYKTRLRHTTGMPPALVAQEFNFSAPDANRKLSRAQLDTYREEFAAQRLSGAPIESWIFKF